MALNFNLDSIYQESVAKTPAPVQAEPAPTAGLSPYALEKIDEVYTQAQRPPEPEPKPRPAKALPYTQNRAAVESGDEEGYWQQLKTLHAVPRKDKLAYVSRFLETPDVNVNGLSEHPLTSAYQLGKLAEAEGYKVVFQSGKRDGGGDSYHDHGEAVDVRFQRRLPNGKTLELTPRENVELGKRLGKKAGWASALDEFHYWGHSGQPKDDPWNQQPHVHLSYGNEQRLLDSQHPMHHLLNKRARGEQSFLSVAPGAKPGKDPKAYLPGLVEITARANGIDPDLAVNWVNAESGFDPKARSEAGAYGLVQMMPETLREIAPKVGITEEEYYNSPKAQIKAGIYYLKQQLKANNGNYARAFAAYNAGPGGLQKIIDGQDYEETKNYVYKILKESDPTVASPEAALDAIRKGTGRTRDVEADKQLAKDTIYNARQEVNDLWSAFSDTASKVNPLETDSLKDAVSPKRKTIQFVNELLNDASFGLIPLTNMAKESREQGDALLADAAAEGDPLAWFGQKGTTFGVGTARALAGAMTGGILGRAARVLPVVGGFIQKGDLITKAGGAAIAEGGSLAQNVSRLLKGGPLDIFKANLAEQVTAGTIAGGTYAAADYFWNPGQETGLDFLQEMVIRGMAGGVHGGISGAGIALGLPLFGGVGLTTLNRLTGIGSANMADNALNVLGKQFGELGTVQRTLVGGAAGALTGTVAGAVGDVTGLTEMVTGEDASFADSLLTGAKIGGGLGAISGGGYNVVGRMLDRAATSAFMTSPQAKAIMEPIRNWVKSQNEQVVRVMSQEYIDDMNRQLAWMKKSETHANAVIHLGNTKDRLQSHEQQFSEWQQKLVQAQSELQSHKMQMAEMEAMESSLSAKYPQAAAHNLQLAQKQQEYAELAQALTDKKIIPTKGNLAKQGQLQAEIENLTNLGTKDKNLAAELSMFQRDSAQIQMRKAAMAKEAGRLAERAATVETEASGIGMQVATYKQMAEQLEDVLAKAADPDALLNIQYNLKLDGPWNKPRTATDARSRLVNMEVEGATQVEELAAILSRQSQTMMRTGKEPVMPEGIRGAQSRFGATSQGPDEFKGAIQQQISDLKEVVEELDKAAPTSVDYKASAKALKEWKAAEEPLTDWKTEVPKGYRVAVVDAQALRAGVIGKAEAAGAAVDRGALWKEAGERAQARFISKQADLPRYSGAVDLAVDAEAAIRQGEKFVPVLVDKAGMKELEELVAAGGKDVAAKAKADALGALTDLEKIFGAVDKPQGYVPPLMTGDKANPTPISGAKRGMAEPAILDHVYKVDQGWASAHSRLKELEKSVTERLGVHGDVENYNQFLTTGNISFLPDEVKNFVASGGDLTSAPPAVKAWSEAVTLARVEEVKRLRQMEEMVLGKVGENTILSSIREAQAAGYQPPTYGAHPKSFFGLVGDVLGNDSKATAQVNRVVAEMMGGDKPPLWRKILPMAQEAYHGHIYTRMNALDIVRNRMMRPYWKKIEENLASKMASKKGTSVTWDVEEQAKFYKDFAYAVEDTGLLQKFNTDYPEAKEAVEFYYGMQTHLESIVAAAPGLRPWVQANYLPLRFRKLASHIKAAEPDERLSMAAAVAKGGFGTLKEIEGQVEAVTKEVVDAGFESADEFLNMGATERAKRWKFFKNPDMDKSWEALKPTEHQGVMKDVEKRVMTLLLQDPVTNPMELLDMQISSVFRADSQRQFLEGMSKLPVAVGKDGRDTLRMVEVNQGSTYKVMGPKGEEAYQALDSLPGFHGVSLDIDGKAYKARDLLVHPEVGRFLTDFSMGSGYSENKVVRNLQRVQSIFRNAVLMGTFIPHQIQTLGAHMMEFAKAPYRLMKLNVAGGNLGGGDELTQAALTANAVRNGLNIRTLERSANVMAKGILDEWGPHVASRLYGIEDSGFSRFLQALDPGDAMAGEAKKLLGKGAQKVADVLGLPAHMDYAVNRELLFRPIEMGQLAGFHFRAQQYLMKNAKALEGLPDQEKMRVAMRAAADQTNRLAGAYPHIYQNNTLRQTAHSLLLTPQWFLSKAYTIADGVDSLIYTMTKGKVNFSEWAGRQAFDYLPPAMRDATRARMATTIMAGLGGSLLMTEAAQYYMDGTSIYDHPPDKLFHIKVGDDYYSGPIYGYVRDVLRFAQTWTSPDGYSFGTPSLDSTKEAMIEAVTRQLNPSLENTANYLFRTRKGEVLDAPDSVAAYLNGIASEVGKAPLETLGVDAKQFKVTNVMGYTPLGSEEQKRAASATMLKAKHYLLRQAGAYHTVDNLDMQIRGHFYDRTKDLERRARAGVQPLLRKAREADSAEEQGRYLAEAYDKFYAGVPVRDKKMQEYYPEGIYRLSDKEFDSLVMEELNPGAKASQGTGPAAMMIAQARAERGRL